MSDKINVYIRGPDNIVRRYFIKKIAPFHKLIHAYCERMNQPMQTVRFCLSDNNTAINGSDTGTSLNLKDCAEIIVFHDESTLHRNQAKSGSTLDLSQKNNESTGRIRVKVINPDKYSENYIIGVDTRLGKLIKSHFERMNLTISGIHFLFAGRTVDKDDTPTSLGMKEGAEIEMIYSTMSVSEPKQTKLSMNALRFRLDGNTFNETDTAASLDMDNDSEIEVFDYGGQLTSMEQPRSVQSAASNQVSNKIDVCLRGPDNIVSRFFIKKNAPFHKLIHAYCVEMNKPMQTVRFCLSDNNAAINGSDTGTSLNLKDCVEIMVFHDEPTPHHDQAKSGSTLDLSQNRTIPVHTESNNMRLKSSINVNLIEPMNDKVTQLKISMHVTMSTLMHGFCSLTNPSMNAVRFLLDGQPLAENDTAASLNLKNGASIEVWFK